MASFIVVVSVLLVHIVVISGLPLELNNEADTDGLHSADEEDYNILYNTVKQALNNEHSPDSNIIDDYLLNIKPQDDKRRFSAWAGKRNSERLSIPWGQLLRVSTNAKARRAFQPWAGKRAFTPWAGKRSETLSDKRSFSPWAGKRSETLSDKRSFSPWAGKRSGFEDLSDLDDDVEEAKVSYFTGDKRGFAPWKGKREQGAVSGEDSKEELLQFSGQKRSFSPWKGKRDGNLGGKRVFSPWAGR